MPSPDPRLASARLHADVDRLRAQAALSWPREARALAQAGLHDGATVLEGGCGPGIITEHLLEALPQARLTALDLDPEMCELARARLAGRFDGRLEIVQSSILFTQLPSNSFDFALARFVFQHLSAPDLALAEILRLLRPGGRLAILDVDDDLGGLVVPRLPAFEVLGRRVRERQAREAGDRQIGRKLWRLLASAGFVEVDLSAVVFHSDELGLEPFRAQFDPRRYRAFLGSGGLTPEEWHAYQAAVSQLFAAPDAFILQLVLLATGTKPA